MTTEPSIDPPLPAVVAQYLQAHDRHDTEATLAVFAPVAVVVDDGASYAGRDEIRSWLQRAASEFTYTRTFLEAVPGADGSWVVRNRIEGDFPGGLVDLSYRVAVADGLITRLEIAP